MGCQNRKDAVYDPDLIVEKSMSEAGSTIVGQSVINFSFRDKTYKATRSNGNFVLERLFSQDSSTVKDVLDNNGFQRFINELPIEVVDSTKVKYAASVNSVHYFSVLPYGLNDKAVNKTYLGKVEIGDKHYFKVKITFDKQGGGEDFEDVFIYWINTVTYTVDYLAYSYNEIDEKGFRFREATNERVVNGVRFVDYNNYKPKSPIASVDELAELFKSDALQLLSRVELKNISVQR